MKVPSVLRAPWVGTLAALVTVSLLFTVVRGDTFATRLNLVTMLTQTAVVGVAAVGMTVVIVSGGIDLSVGSVVALTTVAVATSLRAGHGAIASVLVGVGVAAACGAVNGSLVGWVRLPPFIVTLGTMSIVRGIAKGGAHEQKIDCDTLGIESLLAPLPASRAWMLVPVGVWTTLLAAVAVAAWLRWARAGRHVFAVGSNEATARLCGVPVPRVKLLVYGLAGALAGWAGVLEISRLTVGDPTDSVGLELDVIAAVVIGGASLNGGEGSVAGALIGAMLMTVIKSGCASLGLSNWVQEIVTGSIIILAAVLDRVRHLRASER